MIAFGHVAVGSIIGAGVIYYAPQAGLAPHFVAFILGWISHYLTDAIPHGHYYFDVEKPRPNMYFNLGFDVFIGLGLIVFAAVINSFGEISVAIMGLAIFGALLPDIIAGVTKLKGLRGKRFFGFEERIHGATHWHNNSSSKLTNGALELGWRDTWQVVVLIISSLILVVGDFS